MLQDCQFPNIIVKYFVLYVDELPKAKIIEETKMGKEEAMREAVV